MSMILCLHYRSDYYLTEGFVATTILPLINANFLFLFGKTEINIFRYSQTLAFKPFKEDSIINFRIELILSHFECDI